MSETAEEWIANAEVIIAAGMLSRLLPFIEYTVLNKHDINIEVAEFAAANLRDDPYIWTIVTWFFAFSYLTAEQWTKMQSVEAAQHWQSRWTEEPWPQSRENAFASELLAHSWRALDIQGMMRGFANFPDSNTFLVAPALLDDERLRLADLVSAGPFGPERAPEAPTEVELQRLGEIYRQHVTHFPSAVPTITLCERHCQSQVAACIGAVGVMGDMGFAANPNYTPVLTVEDYYRSERAVRAHHQAMGRTEFPEPGHPEWMVLPQCLVESLPSRVD